MRLITWLGTIFASAALGLIVAALVVRGFQLHVGGFLLSVVIYTVCQSIISPTIAWLVGRNIPALNGGVGVISTFLALFVTHFARGSMQMSGIGAWVFGTLIVWLISGFAQTVMFRQRAKDEKARAAASKD